MKINNPDMMAFLLCSADQLNALKCAIKDQMQTTNHNNRPFALLTPTQMDDHPIKRNRMWQNVMQANREFARILSGDQWSAEERPAAWAKKLERVKRKIERDHNAGARRKRAKTPRTRRTQREMAGSLEEDEAKPRLDATGENDDMDVEPDLEYDGEDDRVGKVEQPDSDGQPRDTTPNQEHHFDQAENGRVYYDISDDDETPLSRYMSGALVNDGKLAFNPPTRASPTPPPVPNPTHSCEETPTIHVPARASPTPPPTPQKAPTQLTPQPHAAPPQGPAVEATTKCPCVDSLSPSVLKTFYKYAQWQIAEGVAMSKWELKREYKGEGRAEMRIEAIEILEDVLRLAWQLAPEMKEFILGSFKERQGP